MVFGIILPLLVEFIADPIKKYVVTPIKCHISYAFKGGSNVQRLQQQVEQLQSKKLRLQQSVDDAKRDGEEIFPDVSKWLTVADKDIGEAEELLQRKDDAKKNKCFFGFCPNLKTRYQLSKNAEKKALAIDKRCNEEGLDLISFQPPLQQIVEPSLYSWEALPSRALMLNQVMDALKDPSLDMIGICGLGGVGKTVLAKEVQAKAMQEKMFDTVVMVMVSQTPEIRRIQAEIADFLGLRFSAEEIPGRASQLYRRLEKSKVLIILDGIWQKLDLNALGIPSQGASKGCKIMLTSRSRDVLSSMMSAQKIFLLEPLNEKETMSLFQMSVAEANNPEFRAIATQIAQKCGGLPLLIQMVAANLRNKQLYEWRHTLNKLSTFGDEELGVRVGKVIESSYDNLPGTEVKSLFLLCALFGEYDIRIQFLLTYSMGMGLIKHIHSIESARDKVLTWISKLKADSLLLDGDIVGFVKMHNVVRDTALTIASRLQHAFVGAGEVSLGDFPNKDCTRIALPFCNIRELPVGLNYPAAELFLLHTEDLSLEIPDSFFDGIRKLKVVDFTGMHLVHLPSSIGLLADIRTLCLHRCRLDNVDILGVLQKLEFLSFANSNIVELPKEIEHLVRLKLLDLRSCSYLQVIPASVLSKLCSLEELYVLNSFVRWDSQDNVSLVELENLACLSTLEIHIPDLKLIPVGFQCFGRLKSYKISIGNVWDWDEQYERSRTLKLQGEAGVHLEGGTELLLRESEDLYLYGVSGIQSIFNEGFPKAKHMHVENDFDIQHLIQSTMGRASSSAFPVLESLHLNKLHSMEKICSGQLGMESFGKLRILKISKCDKLKSLLSFSSGKCLQQLQELEVESCENMEAVVDEVIEEVHHNYGMMEFTQLRSLKLKSLPRLLRLCKLKEVSFPNLTSLEVNECNSLKHIFTASMEAEEIEDVQHNDEVVKFINLTSLKLKKLPNLIGFCKCKEEVEESGMLFSTMFSFPNLSSLEVNGCKSLKYIFSTSKGVAGEGIEDVHINNEEIKFINLSSLKLKNLPQLIGFCKSKDETEQMGLLFNTMVTFHNLISLEVSGCKSLKHVFIASKEGVVDKRIEHVHRKNEVIELNKLSSLKLKKLPLLMGFCKSKEEDERMGLLFSTMVSFPNLTSLEVNGCKSLKHISTASTVKCLMQLISLKIEDCEFDGEIIQSKKLEEIEEDSAKSIVFPKLDCLSLLNLKNVKRFSHRYSFEFPLLTELTVEGCYTMRNFVGNVSCSESEEEEHLFNENVTFSNLERINVGESSSDGGLLEDLQPHRNIKRINIKYYTEEQLPSWMLRMKNPSRGDSFLVLNNLVDLKLEWCRNCVQLPCLGKLPHLKFLEMSNMGKVKCIDNEFYGFNNERNSNGGLNIFPALHSLSLTWMENLTEWSSPSDGKKVLLFPCLQNLSIQSCPKLTGFPMSDLSKLVRFGIKDCQELKLVIDEQQSFSFLACLSVTGCPKLTYLRNWLQSTLSFEELIVRKCEWLTFIPFDLQKVSYLTSLEICCCRRLRHFPGDILSKLRRLQNLSIGAFSEELDDFHYLNRIEDLPCLEELEIWGSDFFGREMRFLPNQLQHLRVLKSLKVMGFTAMEALPEWLTNLQSLRLLSLDYCTNIGYESTTTTIQRLPNLWHLSVSSCPILQGSESEWLLPSHSRKIEVELSQVSKVRVRLGY